MKRLSIITSFLFITHILFAQQHTINGYIVDRQTGEPLIGAAILDKTTNHGTVTNAYGFYTLTLPQDSINLQCSYVGYSTAYHSFFLNQDTLLTVSLETNTELQEVTVTAAHKQFGAEAAQMSAVSVPVTQIKLMPAFLGETDVIKTLQLLPGVQGGTEGSAGMYVRGGGPDENLLLLDGVPVYNINHALGFFSVFDADAIKNVTLYKGSFPAHFGGRLSSVVDVRLNDGNMYKFKGKASIGLISSKFHLEGPLWKGHTSFSISGRRTYYDILLQPILASLSATNADLKRLNAGYYFWDVNAKISHKFSDKDKLFATFYMGDDVVYANIKTRDYNSNDFSAEERLNLRMQWGNIVAALRWNHIVNSQLFLNTSVNYTQYRYNTKVGMEAIYKNKVSNENQQFSVGYNSGIHDVTGKAELDYTPSPNHNLRFGTTYTFHIYRPGVQSLMTKMVMDETTEKIDTTFGDLPINAHETALYAEDEMTLGQYVKMNAGLHYSTMTVDGKFYHSLQPRLSGRIKLYDDLSVKAGYAYMTQYIHLLSNNNVSLPSDLWVPIAKQIKPMKTHQVSLGIFYDLRDWVSFSVEGYYKAMDNLLEYKDGASFLSSSSAWTEKVCQGKGWSYGVELLVQRSIGNTTGWIGYTWSRTMRQFDREGQMLNQGRPFPAKYDRIHDLSITVSHRFASWLDVSASWVFSTGNCATLATQQYMQADVFGDIYTSLDYIEERNNFRFENYHRLDLAANFHYDGKRVPQINHTWSISVYNVYNQKNPFLMYPGYNNGQQVLQKLTLFPVMPTVTYSLSF